MSGGEIAAVRPSTKVRSDITGFSGDCQSVSVPNPDRSTQLDRSYRSRTKRAHCHPASPGQPFGSAPYSCLSKAATVAGTGK